MWSVGTQVLGLSDSAFWDLTYDGFFERYERYMEIEKRWDLRFGTIASTYVNTKLKQGATPLQPGYFFGYYEPEPEMSDDQLMAAMMAFSNPQTEADE